MAGRWELSHLLLTATVTFSVGVVAGAGAAMFILEESDSQVSTAPAESVVERGPGQATEVLEGAIVAGDFLFTDIQVSENVLGSFEVRSRVTNLGPHRSSVVLTATVFLRGWVVGTGIGAGTEWEPQGTRTITFAGSDAYGQWDDVDFQVEFAFD